MASIDFLKELEGKVIDAVTYDLLKRNFDLLSENNQILKENNNLLQDRNRDLERKVSFLNRQIVDFEKKLMTISSPDFVEHEGILWQNKPDGTFKSKPYCPICPNHPVMHEFPPGGRMHWICSVCNGSFDYVNAPPKIN